MNMEKSSLILVTGASGMVGKAFVQRLKTEGFHRLLLPTSKELDNRDQKAVADYLSDWKPDCVFHLSGHIGGIKASISRPVEFMYENLIMAMNVIEGAHRTGVPRLLYVGSSCIYPRECPQPMREEFLLTGALEPTNEGYAIAKIAGIKLCEYLHRQNGQDYVAVIPPNLYGYHDHFEPENSHVISALMYKMHLAKIRGEKEVEVWGIGHTRREFLFVEDFADALLFFANKLHAREHVYINVGAGAAQSVRELAETIKKVVGYEGGLQFNADRPDGMPKKLMDSAKAYGLGWAPRTTLAEGLRKTYDWYLQSLKRKDSENS
jgi:GDP-L-fucose synthase